MSTIPEKGGPRGGAGLPPEEPEGGFRLLPGGIFGKEREKAMQRRHFIRASLGMALGALPGVGFPGLGQESRPAGRVVAVDDFPIPRKAAGIREVSDGDSVILVSANRQIRLNETGLLLWRRVDGKTCTDQLSVLLAEEYGLEAGEAAADVDLFLTRMRRQGFLQLTGYSQRISMEKAVPQALPGLR